MVMFIANRFSKILTALLALAAMLIGRHWVHDSTSKPIEFTTLSEFQEFVSSNQFVFHSGSKYGAGGSNGFLADRPITWDDDLLPLTNRQKSGLTPQWRGIVWVSQIEQRGAILFPALGSAKYRIWGNLLIAGDAALMDRIELLYRSR